MAIKQQQNMPASTLAMWLIIASETMFFVGLIGAFIVLKSAGGQHQLFFKSSAMLSMWMGVGEVAALVVSSTALSFERKAFAWLSIASSLVFLVLQIFQWGLLTNHHSIVRRDGNQLIISDGTPVIQGEMIATDNINLHLLTASDFPAISGETPRLISQSNILADLNYGPSRNNFFASYFLLSGAHCLHLIAGIGMLVYFALNARCQIPDSVQIYCHFVNATGAVAFFVLYFV